MSDNKISRRNLLKTGAAALVAIPVLAISGRAFAAQNAGMRGALKYVAVSTTKDKSCSNCGAFVAPNGCKMMAGDTEISPKGYCTGWNKKA